MLELLLITGALLLVAAIQWYSMSVKPVKISEKSRRRR